jgi:hypothetical protein
MAMQSAERALPTLWCAWKLARFVLFRYQVCCSWKEALTRRSQKGHITWQRMQAIVDRWLPKPRICHPYPLERFAVRTQRSEPGAICVGEEYVSCRAK